MHLMYYVGSDGKRVYTLKVRPLLLMLLRVFLLRATHVAFCLLTPAEGGPDRQAHDLGAPGPLLARRQVLQGAHHHEEALPAAAHAVA